MNSLALPAPQLSWKNPGEPPQIEQPVELRLPAILYPDGAEALEADAQKVGAYVYRLSPAGEEFWNEAEQRWAEAPADPAALPLVPFIYKAGDPLPWQGTLIAIGMKDKDDQPRFSKATGGAPGYRLRAYARFKRDGAVDYEGLSAPSGELEFVSGLENQRFVVEMEPEEQPTVARVKLKNAALADAGYLEIRTDGGQKLELVNCDASGGKLAWVQLAADGTITLHPAAGKKIVLEGDLVAQRIRYDQAGGGGMADL